MDRSTILILESPVESRRDGLWSLPSFIKKTVIINNNITRSAADASATATKINIHINNWNLRVVLCSVQRPAATMGSRHDQLCVAMPEDMSQTPVAIKTVRLVVDLVLLSILVPPLPLRN